MMGLFTHIMRGLQVYPQRMKENLELTRGVIFSQRVLLALIEKGLSRQEAYSLVQARATEAWKGRKDFLSLLQQDPQVAKVLSPAELRGLFDYAHYARYVDHIFQRLGLSAAHGVRPAGGQGMSP